MGDGLVVVGSFAGAAAAIGGACALIWRRFRGIAHLLDDLLGEPARAGVPARPGVMERLANQEVRVESIASQVQILQGQVGVVIQTQEAVRDE